MAVTVNNIYGKLCSGGFSMDNTEKRKSNKRVTSGTTFGAFLSRARHLLGLSQKELADKADLSAAYIALLEQQKMTNSDEGRRRTARSPSEDACKKIAGALGLPEDFVLLQGGYAPKNSSALAILFYGSGLETFFGQDDVQEAVRAALASLYEAQAVYEARLLEIKGAIEHLSSISKDRNL
jgi:transcriptional regulator with XRE-family HTH domain